MVLSRREIQARLTELDTPCKLVCSLLYGSGLRVQECLQMRIQNLDFERGVLLVRKGKGGKDRITVTPLNTGFTMHLPVLSLVRRSPLFVVRDD